MRGVRSSAVLAFAGGLAMWPTLVHADGAVEAAELASERGRAAFDAGRFDEARQAFLEVVSRLPEGHPLRPRALYNLARAEQEVGEHCAAADRFRRYLDTTAAGDAAERKRAEKARFALETERTACQQALGAPAAPPSAVAAPAASAPPAEPAVDLAAQPPPVAEPSAEAGHGAWRWVAAVGAAAAVGAGLTLNVLARGRVTDGDDAYDDFVASGRRDAEASDRADAAYGDARGYATGSYVALGAGVALTGLAVWLFLDD